MKTSLFIYSLKFWCFSISLLALSIPTYSSQNKEDSLLNSLQHQKDTSRINTLNQLAWYYNSQNNDKAELMANTALEEATKIQFPQGITDAHRRLADYYRHDNQYAKSQEHLFVALRLVENSGNTIELAKTLIGIGNLYISTDDDDQAKIYYNKALTLVKENGHPKIQAIIYNNLAQVSENKSDYQSAIDYYHKGLSLEDPKEITSNYLNLVNNIASAFYYLNKTDSAFYYLNLAKSLNIKTGNTDDLIGCYLNEGVFIESSGNYNQAIKSYQKGLKLADNNTDLTTIQNINQNIMLCYGYLGNTDSLDHYFKKNYELNQELIHLKTDQAIHDVSIKYDVEKKEQALVLANQENEKAVLSNQLKQRTIYILLAVIAIISLIVVIFYLLYREKQKLIELEVKSKNNEIEKLIKDQEIKTYKAQLEGIEKERQRVAQDLHDRIGGLLATVKLQFENEGAMDDLAIANVKALVNESIKTVRSISHDLTDGRVDDMGLIKSIENLKQSFTNSSKIHFDLYLENYATNCPIEKEREIFKIILELLSNTLKHADASNIVLQINTLENKVHFTFEDNGNGFEPTKVKNGLGMRTISKRVDKLNGSWYIDSKIGHGSTVVIEIPFS